MDELRQRVADLLCAEDGLGILRRLVIDEHEIDSTIPLLRALGFVHLATVTGIHLYALAAFINRLGFYFTRNLLIGRAVSAGVWLFAWGLTGFRTGMLRPMIIVVLRTIALHLGLKWRPWAPLVLSLVLDFAVMGAAAPGRLHYALAVGGGLMALEMARDQGQFRQHLALALGSWLFVAIYDAWALHQIAAYTPLLSLLTIPLYSQLLYPGVLLTLVIDRFGFDGAAVSLAALLAKTSDLVVEVLAKSVMHLNGLWVISHEAFLGGIVLATAWVYCGSFERRRSFRCALFVLALSIGVIGRVYSRPVVVEADSLVQIDVGQGDAAWVCANHECGMIDTGLEKARSAAGWVGWINRRNMSEIKWIALTHLDEDHMGGVRQLVRAFPVGCVATAREQWQSERGQELKNFLQEHGVRAVSWDEPCFPFEVLSPVLDGSPKKRALSFLKNGAMSSVWIPLKGGASYFNAGDADAVAELRAGVWAERLARNRLGARILKVTHHGSRYSSTEKFLKTYQSDEAWISSGAKNRYGHPAIGVLERLSDLKIPVRRTDQEGDIELRSADARRQR
jgi:competence protein ComEC